MAIRSGDRIPTNAIECHQVRSVGMASANTAGFTIARAGGRYHVRSVSCSGTRAVASGPRARDNQMRGAAAARAARICPQAGRYKIMAVPKRRVSHCPAGQTASHHHLKPRQNTYCNRCGHAILPHAVCWNCGWSNVQGREAVVVEKEEEK